MVSFCFPHDVQPTLLERTPSMSALTELIYSQQYQPDDAVSFVFLLKVCSAACRQHVRQSHDNMSLRSLTSPPNVAHGHCVAVV